MTNIIDTKVNTNNFNTYNNQHILSPIQQEWLNKVCVYISQNDFDTCRNSYDDGQYDICNGYRQEYNTYLWEFENC